MILRLYGWRYKADDGNLDSWEGCIGCIARCSVSWMDERREWGRLGPCDTQGIRVYSLKGGMYRVQTPVAITVDKCPASWTFCRPWYVRLAWLFCYQPTDDSDRSRLVDACEANAYVLERGCRWLRPRLHEFSIRQGKKVRSSVLQFQRTWHWQANLQHQPVSLFGLRTHQERTWSAMSSFALKPGSSS